MPVITLPIKLLLTTATSNLLANVNKEFTEASNTTEMIILKIKFPVPRFLSEIISGLIIYVIKLKPMTKSIKTPIIKPTRLKISYTIVSFIVVSETAKNILNKS